MANKILLGLALGASVVSTGTAQGFDGVSFFGSVDVGQSTMDYAATSVHQALLTEQTVT